MVVKFCMHVLLAKQHSDTLYIKERVSKKDETVENTN